MKLIKNSNNWSCMAASAAMVLDIKIKDLFKKIGHDGSEIMFPDLPEPGRRRGFSIQEIIPVAIDMGYSVTPIETRPCSTPDGVNDFEINFPNPEGRLYRYMCGVKGILTGRMLRWRHAVAWEDLIYDPIGRIYNLDTIALQIDTFWRFDKIISAQKE